MKIFSFKKAINIQIPKIFFSIFLVAVNFIGIKQTFAFDHKVDLVVAYKNVNFAGKFVKAIAVNNQIPAPTLHFKQGDKVIINVYNRLDKGTAIHWHGILVPWQMDGVSGISQKEIPPGSVFRYQFKLLQSGTYWYHAHAGLQEQQGLYGAFIIDPPNPAHYKYSKDYVVVLSDWSNSNPEKIFANLKKDGEYYSQKLPLQPSLFHFIHDYNSAMPKERKNIIADYKMMQRMRMSIYDLSDVAYDAFLLNGKTNSQPWLASVKKGDVVRLRFIGAASSTNFRVKIPGTIMQVIHVQGNDIKPYDINDFMISPGETYDVLIKIQKNQPYIIYAESVDKSGAAYGGLITDPKQIPNYNNIIPFPIPQPVTREMMHTMKHSDSMDHSMEHSSMTKMQHETETTTSGTKYQNLTAATKTNDPNKPVEIIKMELYGYMNHFIWMINDLPEYKAKPILIKSNRRYRIIFTNNSMMHHPMHIHGHWFILRNGHGAYDPLLHTIDVAPGATVVTDFDADASGQWFFHCHHLYHMVAGMSRVFQYQTIFDVIESKISPENISKNSQYVNRPMVKVDNLPINTALIKHPMPHTAGAYLANFLDLSADPFNNVQKFTFKSLFGGDYNKLELFANDAEINQGKVENADLDIFYQHLLSQFWAIKGGLNYFYRPALNPYWQPGIGIEGLMPYFIATDIRSYYHSGSFKFDMELSRDTQITNNFFIKTEIRGIVATKAVTQDSVGSGVNQMRYIIKPYYRVAPGTALFTEFEHQSSYGAFKNILNGQKESTSENTLSFGIAILF